MANCTVKLPLLMAKILLAKIPGIIIPHPPPRLYNNNKKWFPSKRAYSFHRKPRHTQKANRKYGAIMGTNNRPDSRSRRGCPGALDGGGKSWSALKTRRIPRAERRRKGTLGEEDRLNNQRLSSNRSMRRCLCSFPEAAGTNDHNSVQRNGHSLFYPSRSQNYDVSTRGPKARGSWFLQRSWRRDSLSPLPVSRGCLGPRLAAAPLKALPPLHLSSPRCLSIISFCPSLIKTPVIVFRAHLGNPG